MAHRHSLQPVVLALAALAFVGYVGSYVALTRSATREAKQMGLYGTFFLTPENTESWRRINYGCARFYYPLVQIDCLLGTGEPVGHEPMWELSATTDASPEQQSARTGGATQRLPPAVA